MRWTGRGKAGPRHRGGRTAGPREHLLLYIWPKSIDSSTSLGHERRQVGDIRMIRRGDTRMPDAGPTKDGTETGRSSPRGPQQRTATPPHTEPQDPQVTLKNVVASLTLSHLSLLGSTGAASVCIHICFPFS